MNLRATILLICLALAIGGGELFYQSTQMAEWTDETRAEEVQSWDMPQTNSGPAYDAYNKRWAKAMDSVRTQKWPYHDAGAALVVLGLSLTIGMLALGIRTTDDIHALKTPRRGWVIFTIGSVGWFAYWVSAMLGLVEGVNRSMFPQWADSMITPIVYVSAFALAIWLGMCVVAVFVLRGSQLPASLWIWRRDLPMHTGLYTVAAGFSILLALEIIREAYCYGHWLAVPAMLLWSYATLAFRAAGIAKAG
jgi:hypothetical protein